MKKSFFVALVGILVPLAAFSAREGVPTYYQTAPANAGYKSVPAGAYIGKEGQKQVLGTRTYTYQTPVPQTVAYVPEYTMTPNGVAMPVAAEPSWSVSAEYVRRYATFEFETGVNSILKWNDMIFDELGISVQHNFSVRNFDMVVSGEYRHGTLSKSGLSMDYDLKPFDEAVPEYGIFTISMGDESGKTDYFRAGIGAYHVWDIAGWKLTPSIGYEVFQQKLKMSDHYYPNPGVYLPLMNQFGEYIFGDDYGDYYSLAQGITPPDDWYQVCLSPEDIAIAASDANTHAPIVQIDPVTGIVSIVTIPYDATSMGYLPWGVDSGECVIIGGDGPIVVEGTTHIYNTTWSGFYIGLELEKQMTLSDKLRFYFQFGMPKYDSEGIWPNRTDWQQNPSFTDVGSTGAYSYRAEIEYNFKVSERLHLAVKADTNLFHVGKVSGELYIAGYTTYAIDENGQYIINPITGYPELIEVAPHTEKINDSLKYAQWQSFGLHLGVKYTF